MGYFCGRHTLPLGTSLIPEAGSLSSSRLWTPNASGYAPKVYRVSDFELGEDYYFSEQTFPPIAQESRRIRTSRPIRKLRSSSFLCNFVIPGRNILITWAGLITGTSMLSRANHGGGSSRSRTYGVSNVTSLQPAAIATMLIDPYGGKGYLSSRASPRYRADGGSYGDRTRDLKLARLALSQN